MKKGAFAISKNHYFENMNEKGFLNWVKFHTILKFVKKSFKLSYSRYLLAPTAQELPTIIIYIN